MKVLLIMPPFNRLMGVRFSYFPVGLGYITSCLKRIGVDARIYNVENPPQHERLVIESNPILSYQHDNYIHSLRVDDHIVWQEVRKVLKQATWDIVGLSVATAKIGSASKISSLCRENNPNCYIVWGGPHPTIRPDEVLQYKDLDFVIRGEGENTFVELVQAIKRDWQDFSPIKGLSYKKNGQVVHNQSRCLIEDLDSLAFPARDLVLFPERYSLWDMGVMVTSRGCPFNCAFCGAQNIWGRKTRYRSLDNIMTEIKEIVKIYNTKQIFFWDDTFNLNRERLVDLCQRLISEKIGITWRCTARVDLLDEELLIMMRKAGCNSMDIGIETGSERMLRIINKELTPEQIIKGIKVIRKFGINFNAFFMIGFPDEAEEDIRDTFELMKRKEMGNIILSIFTPYPGTALYKRSEELGLIPKVVDWSLFSHQSLYNHFVKAIDKENFKNIVKNIAMYVDRHNRSLKVFLRIHKSEIWFYLKNPRIFFRKLIGKLKYIAD